MMLCFQRNAVHYAHKQSTLAAKFEMGVFEFEHSTVPVCHGRSSNHYLSIFPSLSTA